MDNEALLKDFLTLSANYFAQAAVLLSSFLQQPPTPRVEKKKKAKQNYNKSGYQLFADSCYQKGISVASMAEKSKWIATEWKGLSKEAQEKWRSQAKKLRDKNPMSEPSVDPSLLQLLEEDGRGKKPISADDPISVSSESESEPRKLK